MVCGQAIDKLFLPSMLRKWIELYNSLSVLAAAAAWVNPPINFLPALKVSAPRSAVGLHREETLVVDCPLNQYRGFTPQPGS